MISSTDVPYTHDISVFHNPTEDCLRMTFHDYLPQQATARFYDMTGKHMLQLPLLGGANVMDISILPRGSYVYEVMDQGVVIGNGQVVRIQGFTPFYNWSFSHHILRPIPHCSVSIS